MLHTHFDFIRSRFSTFKKTFAAFLLSTALLILPSVLMADTKDVNPCPLDEKWFPNSFPTPQELNEEFQGATNCQFHQWAWGAFLYSTQNIGTNENPVLRFESFPSFAGVMGDGSQNNNSSGAMPSLQVRAGKGDHPINSIAQAGTNGILVTPNQRATYYSQYVNPQMATQIIVDGWNTAEGIRNESQYATFWPGNIEYKAAWAIVDGDNTFPNAYKRMAQVPNLANNKVAGVTTIGVPATPTYRTEKVALIGFHVVGWVNGHSEAIWATFSPKDMSIVTPPTISQPASCNQAQVPLLVLDESSQLITPVTDVCQTYESGTKRLILGNLTKEQQHQNDKNQANLDSIRGVNASAAKQLPSDSPVANYEEIGAVWSVTDLIAYCGSLSEEQRKVTPECTGYGVDGSGLPLPGKLLHPSQISAKLSSTFQKQLIGSTVLSNPVIETFTQTTVSENNCFGCHNSLGFQPSDPNQFRLKPSMLNLSHFLMQIYVDNYTAPKSD